MKYDKLVRDKIPQLLMAQGKEVKHHTATEEEYWQKLKEKLQEEASEYFADETELELADLLEVIDAICAYKGIDFLALKKLQAEKANERGSFKDRIMLDEVVDHENR